MHCGARPCLFFLSLIFARSPPTDANLQTSCLAGVAQVSPRARCESANCGPSSCILHALQDVMHRLHGSALPLVSAVSLASVQVAPATWSLLSVIISRLPCCSCSSSDFIVASSRGSQPCICHWCPIRPFQLLDFCLQALLSAHSITSSC